MSHNETDESPKSASDSLSFYAAILLQVRGDAIKAELMSNAEANERLNQLSELERARAVILPFVGEIRREDLLRHATEHFSDKIELLSDLNSKSEGS